MTTWIGLTGGIGSGKSQTAALFGELGVPLIDADTVNRTLTDTPNSPPLCAIRRRFGEQALDASGRMNRPHIRQTVFNDPQAKRDLEAILHPFIFTEIRSLKNHFTDFPYGIIEIAILAEQPVFRNLVERVLLVSADENVRIGRVMRRSGLTEAEVRAIIAAQAAESDRRSIADDIINNNGSLKDLQETVFRQHQIYTRLYSPAH
jgi:dephospho-coA kinase